MAGSLPLQAVRGPVRVALAPLAGLLAAVDMAMRRPSVVVAGTLLLICLPSGIGNVTAQITLADVAAGRIGLTR